MAITAQMVKALREKTGAGMMDCKKALVESGGDEEKAIVYLREKGLAKAAKKAGRATSEGLITIHFGDDGKTAGMAELKCETDFVAKNEDFIATAAAFAQKAAEAGQTEGMGSDIGMDDLVTDLIAKLGENMQAGRFVKMAVAEGSTIGSYIHSNNKLGVIVELTGDVTPETAKDVAMQVAAANPVCISPDELPQDVLEKEKAIYLKQAMDEGKPQEIAEKIVMGRIGKYYKEVCLLEQPFIKEDKKSVKQILGKAGVSQFYRLALGEDAKDEEE